MDINSDDESGSHENHAFEEESSVASAEVDEEEIFCRDLPRVRRNDPDVKSLCGHGDYEIFNDETNEGWEAIGRDISNNSHLEQLYFIHYALDDEALSSLFRGLSKSSSIIELDLGTNNFSAAGLRSLEPFVQNSVNLRQLNVSFSNIQTGGFKNLWKALCGSPIERLDCSDCGITSIEIENAPTNLRELSLGGNNVQTEGFNILMQVLRDSPIERLYCFYCGITSIEIETVSNNLRELCLHGNHIQSEGFNRLLRSLRDSSIEVLHCRNCDIESIEIINDSFPRKLKTLVLATNRIDSCGCRGIAKLLQEENMTLRELYLNYNRIGDEGVAILADALKSNTSLEYLDLEYNGGISRNGRLLMLQLVNDISSIKATLQSNDTLQTIRFGEIRDDIRYYTDVAIKSNSHDAVTAGREKIIQTQLHSIRRAELAEIQGVQHSLYSEIKPLHLPEVLSLVGREHGQDELYAALKASIVEVMTTANRKRCMQQRIAYHDSKIAEHEAVIAEHRAKQRELREEIATMEGEVSVLAEQCSTKRRRK